MDYAALTRKGFDERRLQLLGRQPTNILANRLVAYPKEDPRTYAEGVPAESLIKGIMRQNMGPGAGHYTVAPDGVRDTSATIAIAPDQGRGANITLEYAHVYLLDLFQEIAAQSAAAGQPIYFIIEQIDDTGTGMPYLQMEVYEGQLGTDRTQGGGNPEDVIVLTPENETIAEYDLVWDWRNCINRAYAGVSTSDEMADYGVVTASDIADQLAKNPLALREGFQTVAGLSALEDATGLDVSQILANKARGLLATNACVHQLNAL
ncbi:MAG: siphovirus ReqiPepy6 Gp37-like family protein, partial [Proteobacteria bacterium]|nr:siphovirus ReqiPepy6 Gp37-like family protein [Pseudomonadota bacterium]